MLLAAAVIIAADTDADYLLPWMSSLMLDIAAATALLFRRLH